MFKQSIIVSIAVAALLISGVTLAQTAGAVTRSRDTHPVPATYRMSTSNDVWMYLAGSTPVKDWKMTAHGLHGEAQMQVSKDNQLLSIEGLAFSLPVHNLKGEGGSMDEHAYRSLKADQYKEITFSLISSTVEPLGPGSYSVKTLGNLSVAGVTRPVTLSMRAQVQRDGSLLFTGAEHLKMSDYNVERPSVLFGIIKADDAMTLTYNLIFSK